MLLAPVLEQGLTMELTGFVSDEVLCIGIIILGKYKHHGSTTWKTRTYRWIGLFCLLCSCWFFVCLGT